jgi:hypothetical protein
MVAFPHANSKRSNQGSETVEAVCVIPEAAVLVIKADNSKIVFVCVAHKITSIHAVVHAERPRT